MVGTFPRRFGIAYPSHVVGSSSLLKTLFLAVPNRRKRTTKQCCAKIIETEDLDLGGGGQKSSVQCFLILVVSDELRVVVYIPERIVIQTDSTASSGTENLRDVFCS